MNKLPILSEYESRKTLAAKKKPKLILKNLLAQPFERYWPELQADDAQRFKEIFQVQCNLGLRNKQSKSMVSQQKDNENLPTDDSSKLKLGLQSSIRRILSGERLALFISTKIRPRHIADQIIILTLTRNENSKIFCVPNMDEVLLEVLGFSCQCLVILEYESEIWNWILIKSREFPVPEDFIYRQPAKYECMDVDCNELPPAPTSQKDEKVDFSKLYVLKNDSKERTFIPNGAVRTKLENIDTDFISLGKLGQKIDNIRPTNQMISKIQIMEKPIARTCSKLENLLLPDKFSMKHKKKHNQNSHTKNKVNYVSLKINRVQPNPDKKKKKKKKKK